MHRHWWDTFYLPAYRMWRYECRGCGEAGYPVPKDAPRAVLEALRGRIGAP